MIRIGNVVGDGGGKKPPWKLPEQCHDAWLRAEIEAVFAELDAGRGVPAEKVLAELARAPSL